MLANLSLSALTSAIAKLESGNDNVFIATCLGNGHMDLCIGLEEVFKKLTDHRYRIEMFDRDEALISLQLVRQKYFNH